MLVLVAGSRLFQQDRHQRYLAAESYSDPSSESASVDVTSRLLCITLRLPTNCQLTNLTACALLSVHVVTF